MATYLLAYTDAGTPKTGLSPTLDIYVKAVDGTSAGSPPAVTELSGGLYKFSVAVAELVVARIDSNDGAMADGDRYIYALLRPDDSDAYVDSIADSVWDELKSGHTGVTTFGDVGQKMDAIPADVDTQLSTQHGSGSWEDVGGPGDGANAVTVTVTDVDTSLPIPGAIIQVHNASETMLLVVQITDANGQVGLLLDDGSYKVRIRKLGTYSFANPFTLTVSGAASQTFQGTVFSPSTPPAPETCVVYGWTYKPSAEAAAVKITAQIDADLRVLSSIPAHVVAAQILSTTANASTGYWELVLIRSAVYHDPTTKYLICVDGKLMGKFLISNQSSVAFTALVKGS